MWDTTSLLASPLLGVVTIQIASDIGARLVEFRAAAGGWSQAQLAKAMGRERKAVGAWETGARAVPVAELLALAGRYRFTPSVFMEGGPRPAEAIQAPLTGLGMTTRQVAEELIKYTAPRPVTADAERVQRAIGLLEMVLQELKASIKEGPTGAGDIVEFVKTAEAGHPSQPPRARRRGKSG